jgi:hypothetical protein
MPKAFSLEFRRDVVAVARKGEAPSGQQRVTRRFAAGPVRCGVGAGQRCRFAGVLVELACQPGVHESVSSDSSVPKAARTTDTGNALTNED